MASLDTLTSGASIRVAISDPVFGMVDLGKVVSFSQKEDATIPDKPLMDGSVLIPKFRQGYSGSFVAERTNNNFDRYVSFQDERYYAGLDETLCTIVVTVLEIDGAITQLTFLETQFVATSLGDYQGQDTVQYHVNFKSRFRKVTT